MATPQAATKVVLCTGGNRGLGYAILQIAGSREPTTNFILASRDLQSGREAADKLANEGIKAHVDVVQMDVTNDGQILEAVKFVASTYGKLDVLINNAGIISIIPDFSLPSLRKCCNEMLDVNVTSAACVATAFQGLLRKSPHPKVINLTSGLGSMQNTLTKKMARYPPYGISKVGINGLTVHMQVMENDRIADEQQQQQAADGKPGAASQGSRIDYYSVAPGLLNTAFTHYAAYGKDPKLGAEVIVRLVGDDGEKAKYEGGTQWEYEDGEMRTVPW